MRINYLLAAILFLGLSGGAACAAEVAAPTQPADDGMVLIPAGEFSMGSNKEENAAMWRQANALNPYGFNEQLYINERPAHKVNLPAYFMDKYEVTNGQYFDFWRATGHRPPDSWVSNGYNLSNEFLADLPLEHLRNMASDRFKLDRDVNQMTREAILAELDKMQTARDALPVTTVTWSDANDYCEWAGKRLPSEAEWEKAARGPEGFEYPWGNQWDPKKINAMAEDSDAPYSPSGSFPGDKSAYGVYDLAANVSEWVADWYDAYPGATPDPAIRYYGKAHRVVRGGMTSSGHYDSLSVIFRAARRMHQRPDTALIDLGFRCAKDAK
ncbi:MAG: SUMF1/EgtB/PvdO family nonheme iron enzyme [Nitrosomonadales bacterium]|nr:SUMF1/EgtB/PvdO family nonheme iron enzyme [Nitrosomonadales bacterium]